MLSNYYGYPSHISTVLEGIKQKAGKNVIFEQSLNLADYKVFKSTYNAKLFSFESVLGFNANYFQNTKTEGEALIKRIDNKVDFKWGDGHLIDHKIIIRDMSARWNRTFTPEKTGV